MDVWLFLGSLDLCVVSVLTFLYCLSSKDSAEFVYRAKVSYELMMESIALGEGTN